MPSARAISLQAFFTLLLIALMMASNHIAARVAFNSGLDVSTAVATRSLVTAAVVAFLLLVAQVSWRFNRQQGRGLLAMPLILLGLALVGTQHETAGMDGRLRTFFSLLLAGSVALAVIGLRGGPQWPQTLLGWQGLGLLTLLYGTAFTIMFTVLPKLGVAPNSAIMNVEPVFALALGWAVLDQHVAWVQVGGALMVVGVVVGLGLRKQSA